MASLFALYGETHGVIQLITWFFLENVLLWAQNFKHISAHIYIHIACAIMMSLLHVSAAMMMLLAVQFGISGLHKTVGFSILLILPFILVSGSICKLSKTTPKTAPKKVWITNKGHTIFGWLVIIACKIPLYTGLGGTKKIMFFVIDIISHLTFLYLKYFNKKLGAKSISGKFRDPSVRKVTSRNDLRMYGNNYFMFANYIYSTDLLIGQHPGGWQIINKARGRDVDRFVYGSEPLEAFEDIGSVSHSANSLNLAGDPIARLEVPSAYQNMGELNEVAYNSIININSNTDVYLVYLENKDGTNIKYKGYQYLNQLGQYYTLTSNSKLSRLYTTVNFLTKNNIAIMEQISNKSKLVNSSTTGRVNNEIYDNNRTNNLIPLLIKKYEKGKFTDKYLSMQFNKNLLLSSPRGFGLSLHEKLPGQIVLFSGGTGLNPYSDLIDLLFKDLLIKSNHRFANYFRKNDPLLNLMPFEPFKFRFYLAVDQVQQIHPITLYQLSQLSKSERIKCVIKTKQSQKTFFMKNYSSIELTQSRFETFISSQINNPTISHIYICGPTRMTKSLVDNLQGYKFSSEKYQIM